MSLSPKPARFSQAEQINIVMSGHINGAGRLFGGILVEWIDAVAAVCSGRPHWTSALLPAHRYIPLTTPPHATKALV